MSELVGEHVFSILDDGRIFFEDFLRPELPPGTWRRDQISTLIEYKIIGKTLAIKVLREHSKHRRLNDENYP